MPSVRAPSPPSTGALRDGRPPRAAVPPPSPPGRAPRRRPPRPRPRGTARPGCEPSKADTSSSTTSTSVVPSASRRTTVLRSVSRRATGTSRALRVHATRRARTSDGTSSGPPGERRLGPGDRAVRSGDVGRQLHRPARAVPLPVPQVDPRTGEAEVRGVVVGGDQVAGHRRHGHEPVPDADELWQHEPRPDVELHLLLEVLTRHADVHACSLRVRSRLPCPPSPPGRAHDGLAATAPLRATDR